jgi:hypothetical protein
MAFSFAVKFASLLFFHGKLLIGKTEKYKDLLY